MSADMTSPSAPHPRPWGLLASIAWCTAEIAVWMLAQIVVIAGYVAWHEPGTLDMAKLGTDGFLLAFATIMAGPMWIGVLAFAARWRGWSVRDYLALVPPRRGEVPVRFVACLAPLLISVRPVGARVRARRGAGLHARRLYLVAGGRRAAAVFHRRRDCRAGRRRDCVSRLPVPRPQHHLARRGRYFDFDLGRSGPRCISSTTGF